MIAFINMALLFTEAVVLETLEFGHKEDPKSLDRYYHVPNGFK